MEIELPEHVASKTARLGVPLAQFASSGVQIALYLVLGVATLALGTGVLVFTVVTLVDPAPNIVFPFRLLVLGPFLLFAGVGMLIKWKRLRGSIVVVFDQGLAQVRGRDCEIMRWDEIRLIRRGKPSGANEFTITKPSRVSLEDDQGREWVFTEALSGLKEFRTLAEERTLPHMLPVALDLLLGGRTLMFGDIGASEEGLTSPHRPLLPWNLIAQIGVEGGVVQVVSTLSKKAHCRVEVYDVPNAHLLLALADQFRRG